jgi:hypothetical protein
MIVLFLPRMVRHRLSRERAHLLRLVDYALWIIIVAIAYSVGIFVLEKMNPFETIWLMWQTFSTVGYGDMPPVSDVGRLYTVIMSVAGIGLFGAVISAYFDYRIEQSQRRRFGRMTSSFQGHYMLLNYPGKHALRMYMREILSREPGARFCVVDSKLEELPPEFASEANVCFIRGSLFCEETYERARLHDAKFVLIYPADCEDDSCDGATESALDIATTYINKKCVDGDRPRFMCYLVNPDNRLLFSGAENASLIPMDFEIMVGVQEAHDPGTAAMIGTLLCNEEEANPHTVVPRRIVGLSWADLQRRAIEASSRHGVTVNILALMRDGGISSIVAASEQIKPGDRLSVLALPGFDWDDFERKLMEFET